MPITPTYPGVYIEEVSSGVRTITPVATSRTVFIGRASRGHDNKVTRISSFADFERLFGGLNVQLTLPYSVQQFFEHGGTDALIIRVSHEDATPATAEVKGLKLKASGTGSWGNNLQVRIDHNVMPKDGTNEPRKDLFNLFVRDSETRIQETFLNLSINPDEPRHYGKFLEERSLLIRSNKPESEPEPDRPDKHGDLPADASQNPFATEGFFDRFGQNGSDGTGINDSDIQGNQAIYSGIFALDKWESEFNLMVIPPLDRKQDVGIQTLKAANKYCADRRAMLLIDSPTEWNSIINAEAGITELQRQLSIKKNAAVFFPRLKMPDPKRENRTADFPAAGAVAGICARTDATRGVWKSPAGIEATFSGVTEFTVKMTDVENGRLNVLGINCLRYLPGGVGNVVWGSRTLDGADRLASEWKYLAVRRMALFLEESLYQGTQWVVFEPNDEPLWSQIRLNVGAFMHGLFRQGAFQGRSPREAYFVRCDKTTTTQNDINRGIVNIEVGFAPLKPAEFVIIKFSQIAGEIQT